MKTPPNSVQPAIKCISTNLSTIFDGYEGFDDYDQWQKSGVSHQGALSFYYPETAKKCVDCHMPLIASTDAANINGKVHNHRFPSREHSTAFCKSASRATQNSNRIFYKTKWSRWICLQMAHRSHVTALKSSEVRTHGSMSSYAHEGVGHRFPAGTIDAFDIWLEVKATDENGKIVFWER